jgi:hypothetical protein
MDTTVIDVNGGVNQVAIAIIWIVFAAVVIIQLLGMAKVFKKAGKPAWAVIVPFYNLFLMAQIAGRPDSWGIILCVSFIIPYIGPIIGSVFLIIISIDIAKNFGKGPAYGVGLWLLPFIFYPMLGFGDANYSIMAQVSQPE